MSAIRDSGVPTGIGRSECFPEHKWRYITYNNNNKSEQMTLFILLLQGIEEDFISWKDGFEQHVFPALLGQRVLQAKGVGKSGGCACGACGACGGGGGQCECGGKSQQVCSRGKPISSRTSEQEVMDSACLSIMSSSFPQVILRASLTSSLTTGSLRDFK